MKYEQFAAGESFDTDDREVTAKEIAQFASHYDRQPLHTDPAFAARGPFGEVIASGFHTLAVAWNLWMTHGAMGSDGRGGVALDRCRWHEPVFAGDRLKARVTVGERRITRKGRGFVRLEFQVLNQHGRTVLEFDTSAIVARDGDEARP